MRRCAVLALLILASVQKAWTLNSVLDLPECSTAKVSKDVSFPAESHVLTEDTRSLIECAVICMDSVSLECVRETTTGKCYELNQTMDRNDSNSGELSPVGQLITFMVKDKHDNCNGRKCASKEVCMKSCADTNDLDVPICVGNNRGDCEIYREYSNIRYYWSPMIMDNRDKGAVMIATYPKRQAASGLRVIMHMVVRGHLGTSGCTNWYVAFDGNKCNNPANIDMLDYSGADGDLHRSMDSKVNIVVDGTCYGLEAGDRKIELVIGPCNDYNITNGHVGWSSARSMIVMEMDPQDISRERALTSCSLLNVFNYQYNTWVEEHDETVNLTQGGRLLKEITYKKMADDTNLRIKYTAVAAVVDNDLSRFSCGRWYIKIDGTGCSPQLDFQLYEEVSAGNRFFDDHKRSRTAEGICENRLAAGNHTIEIWVGECVGVTNSQPTRVVTGGFNSSSRLHVEEVRQNHTVDGVRMTNEMYRSQSGNLVRHHWWSMNSFENEGDLAEIVYLKEYEDTALRLTASGDHRTHYHNGYSHCGRWFFKIDGMECTVPGTIEGINFFNYDVNVHLPMQVSGICHGVSRGSHSIQYSVGKCAGQASAAAACTGYQSSFHIFIEELRVDLIKTCSELPVNCDV